MKAIRTIVATAVIVFALTTVATAGVQRLTDDAGTHQTAVRTGAAEAQSSGSVTLSDEQFAALLSAVADDRGSGRAPATRTGTKPAHGDHERDRDHARDRDRAHAGAHAVRGRSETTAGARVHHAEGTAARARTRTHVSTQKHDAAHASGGRADRGDRHTGDRSDGGHGGGHHGGGHD